MKPHTAELIMAFILGGMLGVLFGACSMLETVPLGARGHEGQECYPNNTCNRGLTCYELGYVEGETELMCYGAVTPAALELP